MKRPLVLIVDDNVIALKLFRKYFEASEIDVIEATDGQLCLDMARKHLPDVILLDVMMPKLDGYQTIKILKTDERTIDIPVIILTALNDTSNQSRAVDCGADDFLSKPIEEKLVLGKVRLFAELGCLKKRNAKLKLLLKQAVDSGFNTNQSFEESCK
jgi:two-component system cell cycle response regulator